jgi:predicted nucleic acid-binding protein
LDANGIIGLAKAGCLALLPRLFREVYVPPQVVPEITDPTSRVAVQAALADWLKEGQPTTASLQQSPASRGQADRSVLALALDYRPCTIVTGDRWIVNQAMQLGIPTINVPALIQLLARAGIVQAAKPYLDQMIALGFGIPPDLYASILQSLGE